MNEINDLLNKFVSERNWNEYHNSKDLAFSLNLEAAELLENFQWISAEDAEKKNYENIKDEIADVFIYGIMLANKMNIDLEEAIIQKIKKNEQKYPLNETHKFK